MAAVSAIGARHQTLGRCSVAGLAAGAAGYGTGQITCTVAVWPATTVTDPSASHVAGPLTALVPVTV
jgi:hypothetical protein